MPYFTTQDAFKLGVTGVELRDAVSEGSITRLMRGWYSPQPLPWATDRHRLLVRIAIAERTDVVPSHHSAAIYLGLPVHRFDWRVVHLMRTDDGAAQVRRGLTIHKRAGTGATLSVALAIAQTGLMSVESGVMAFDVALRDAKVTRLDVRNAADLLDNRPGHARLGAVLRLGDGRRESPLESRTAVTFDRWKMRLAPQFDVPGTPYRADARIVGTAVLGESDGHGKYDGPSALTDEKAREDTIRSRGWEVVRVTDELLNRPKDLHARVQAALERASRLKRPPSTAA